MVHVLLLSQDSDGHLSKRGEGPARSLLGYHLQGEHLWRYGGGSRPGRAGVVSYSLEDYDGLTKDDSYVVIETQNSGRMFPYSKWCPPWSCIKFQMYFGAYDVDLHPPLHTHNTTTCST